MRAERIALLAAWSLAAGTAHAAIEAETQPARQFGYTIGDVIHQTVRLSPGAGQTLIEESLPKPGRAGAWVERRDVEAVRAGSEWRIELRYQFINSPPDLRTVALPALRVQLRDGDRIRIDIPGHQLEAILDPAEIETRRATAKPRAARNLTGWLKRYAGQVGNASSGAAMF